MPDPDPEPPEPSPVDRLIAEMQDFVKATRTAAPPTPRDEPAPRPPVAATPTESEIAAKFEELINAGRGKEALDLATQHAFLRLGPAHVMLVETRADQQREKLRRQYQSAKWWPKAEAWMDAEIRSRGLTAEVLARDGVYDDLLGVVLKKNREEYDKDQFEDRLVAEKAKWDAEHKAGIVPPSLAPIQSLVHDLPDPRKDRAKEILERMGITTAADIAFLQRQIATYNAAGANLTLEAVLHQMEKRFDPRYSDFRAEGTSFESRAATMIGERWEDRYDEQGRQRPPKQAGA